MILFNHWLLLNKYKIQTKKKDYSPSIVYLGFALISNHETEILSS